MPSPGLRCGFFAALFGCALALVCTGCKQKTVKAAPPVAAPPAATTTKPPRTQPAETNPAPLPETPPPATPPPAPPAKPAPRRQAEKPPAEPEPEPTPPAVKPPAPQISPQLSPQESAEYQKKTNEDIDAAEKNLQQADGRSLNASQHDLVEKIRGFLGQSREAIHAADWVRARNLAQKAHVLSTELVNSL